MDNKGFDKIMTIIGVVLVIGLIYQAVKHINKSTETKVISDEGLAALQDPQKKQKIDQAIADARKHHNQTGVWVDPVVDLN